MARHPFPSPRSIAGAFVALLMLSACVDVPQLDDALANARAQAQTTKIYAADGSLITELHAEENREVIPLSQVPKVMRDAIIAIEDARFYKHAGVDYQGVLRALTVNAASGKIVEGGSTITQQLVKNTLVTNERTFKRKVQEAMLSFQLEQKLSKDEILERYLNTVYFGRGAYGIQAAARRYFDRNAVELNLPQAALLAGLVRSPSRYDPSDVKQSVRRRNIVLNRMRDEHMISDAAWTKARRAGLGLHPGREFDHYRFPYFIDYVKQQIFDGAKEFKVLGATRADRINAVFKGGLRIFTTIDPKLQRTAEETVKDTLPYKSDPYTAFVGLNPKDGAVVTMVGGRNFFSPKERFAKLNLAVRTRQPGSSFKPFTLVAALEHGIPLERHYRGGSRVFLRLPNGTYWNPGNYEGNNFGSSLSVLRATALSVNVVYAQMVLDVGPRAVVEVAHRMGIQSHLDPAYAIALGTEEVSPLEMAGAYATLANGGFRVPTGGVSKITDASGKIIYERKVKPKRVLAEPIAALATRALEEVMRNGTGRRLQLGRPAGGKTGTTEEYHDAWFAGFTPNYVAVSWVGFPQGQISLRPPRTRIRVFGSSWPGHMWQEWMLAAHRGLPDASFPTPESLLVKVRVDTSRDCLPNEFTPPFLIRTKTYIKGSEPTEVCTEPTSGDIESTPDVVGKKASDARVILERAGFYVVSVSQFCPAFTEGTVCDQSPAPGSASTVGSRATIFISNDTAVSEVPMVLGRTLARAREKLAEYGYKVRVVYRSNSENYGGCRDAYVVSNGRVWAQSPCASANYGRGSTVTIYVNP
jgi:penicillin-binding protein 1A